MKKRADGRYQRLVTIEGKRVAFYSSEPTERKAERDLQQQVDAYCQRGTGHLSFVELADAWEEAHAQEIAFNTAQKYGRAKKKAVAFFEDMDVCDITVEEVQRFINYYAAQKYARDSISCYLSVVSQIIQHGIQHYGLRSNPCEYAKIPRGLSKTTREPPSPEEMQKILSSVSEPFGLYPFTAVLTGLRREELLALTWADVDLDGRTIHVTKAITFQHNRPVVSPTKTRASVRDVNIPAALLAHLRERAGRPGEYLFPGADAQSPMTEQMFRKAYARYQNATGVTSTSHCLRHGYSSLLYDAGIDAKQAQAQLGHSKLSTTMDIYTHISDVRRKAGLKQLDEYLAAN